MIIGVHGSYYGYNFGDTLLVRLFSDWVRAAGGTVLLPLASKRNASLIGADRRGLLAFPRMGGLILAGGGYFSEPDKGVRAWTKRIYRRHIWLTELAFALKIPVAILGVGAGPVSDQKLRSRIARIFERAAIVVVRDKESEAFLREIGVRREIVVASDAALAVRGKAAPCGSLVAIGNGREGARRLLLHTAPYPHVEEMEAIRVAAKGLLQNPRNSVVLMTDSIARRRPIRWQKGLQAELGEEGDRVQIWTYDANPDSLIDLISEADGVITTKLHVGIVSTALHKPVLALPRHSKTQRFYQQLGMQKSVIHVRAGWEAELARRIETWPEPDLVRIASVEELRGKFSYEKAVSDFVKAAAGASTGLG